MNHPDSLALLASAAESIGDALAQADLDSLAQRVAEGRFYVACIGQFKRGKSTLLDALLDDAILPTGVLPLTACPTVIRYGQARAARVRFGLGQWREIGLGEIGAYVSEEGNPSNAKGVTGAEIFLPHPLLASGLCLVDTPGIGSVFAANTEATREFLPHVDAVLLVIGADPPISADELAMAVEAGREVRDIIVVLNKADKATELERETVTAFARRVLGEKLGRDIGPIYRVSALEQLEGARDRFDWAALTGRLRELAECGRVTLVREAERRGAERIGRRLERTIERQRTQLAEPLEASERRIAALRTCLTEAERQVSDLQPLFTAQQARLFQRFDERREAFMERAVPEATARLQEVARHTGGSGPRLRRALLARAQEIAEAAVKPWLEAEEAWAEAAYAEAAGRFTGTAADVLERLAGIGAEELVDAADSLRQVTFRVPRRYYFFAADRIALDASPVRFVTDVVLGLLRQRRVMERQAQRFMVDLLDWNSTRVRGDLDERVHESRQRLQSELVKLLHSVRDAAETSLARVRAARDEGAAGVAGALTMLDAAAAAVQQALGAGVR